jgi:hypothetical protein
MNYPIEDYILKFVARRESPEDVQNLKEYLANDPNHREELKQWLFMWDIAGMLNISIKFSPDKAFRYFLLQL